MQEPQHEPRFMIDVVYGDGGTKEYVTIGCSQCLWMAELNVPAGLNDINHRATEHLERCRPG
jgi:hypothetical protein